MTFDKTALTTFGSTTLFVLLWSSGAIFAKLGLDHASAFAFLVLRFALAFTVLLALGMYRRRLLPAPGTRLRVAITGLLLTGGYSICYLLALDLGITPGVLATVLGVQPILTLLVLERRFSIQRLIGLVLAMSGLVLVVYQNIALTRFSVTGISFALAALGCMTIGALVLSFATERQQIDSGFAKLRLKRTLSTWLAQAGAGNLQIGVGPDFVIARFHCRGFIALLLQL
jgi:drug/metabolite transporter (DMT)-like permease